MRSSIPCGLRLAKDYVNESLCIINNHKITNVDYVAEDTNYVAVRYRTDGLCLVAKDKVYVRPVLKVEGKWVNSGAILKTARCSSPIVVLGTGVTGDIIRCFVLECNIYKPIFYAKSTEVKLYDYPSQEETESAWVNVYRSTNEHGGITRTAGTLWLTKEAADGAIKMGVPEDTVEIKWKPNKRNILTPWYKYNDYCKLLAAELPRLRVEVSYENGITIVLEAGQVDWNTVKEYRIVK